MQKKALTSPLQPVKLIATPSPIPARPTEIPLPSTTSTPEADAEPVIKILLKTKTPKATSRIAEPLTIEDEETKGHN